MKPFCSAWSSRTLIARHSSTPRSGSAGRGGLAFFDHAIRYPQGQLAKAQRPVNPQQLRVSEGESAAPRELTRRSQGSRKGSRSPTSEPGSWATMRPMDFQLTEQQELIRKEVAALARSFSLDYWLEKDKKAEYPWDWVKKFAQAGWLGMIIPEEYGGAGPGVTQDPPSPPQAFAAGARTRRGSP